MSLIEKCTVWQMGAFWGSDRKWDSISKGFQAELFCYIQMEIEQLEERASKLGFGWLIGGVLCMPFIWLNIALLSTSGGGFCWGQAHAFLPVVSVSCSTRDLEGLSFKHSRGEENYLFNWSFGCYQVFFYSQAHSDKWLEQTALPTRSSIGSIQSGCDCSVYLV